MAKCTFWYQLTWVVPDKVQRAVKWLCVWGWGGGKWVIGLGGISLGQSYLYEMPSNAFLLCRL